MNVRDFVAPERLRMEVLKAMSADKPSKFFNALKHTGSLKYVFPSLDDVYSLAGGKHHAEGVFAHCLEAGDWLKTNNHLLRLAAFLHDVGKATSSLTMKVR